MTNLGTLGGSNSLAWNINGLAQVVGRSFLAEGGEHAFLWEDGVMIDPGYLGPSNCEAYSINEAGQIVGECETFEGLSPVLWRDGQILDLSTIIEDAVLSGNAINNLGQILLWAYLYDPVKNQDSYYFHLQLVGEVIRSGHDTQRQGCGRWRSASHHVAGQQQAIRLFRR